MKPNFTGNWIENRSSGIDNYLKAIGIGWLQRKVIVNLNFKMKNIIIHTDNEWQIKTQVGSKIVDESNLKINEINSIKKNDKIISYNLFWSENTLVTEISGERPTIIKRTLENGTMKLIMKDKITDTEMTRWFILE